MVNGSRRTRQYFVVADKKVRDIRNHVWLSLRRKWLKYIESRESPSCQESSVRILRSGSWILFLTCSTGKWRFWGNSNYRRAVINPAHVCFVLFCPFFSFVWWWGGGGGVGGEGSLKTTFELAHASCSLPEWQTVKLSYFAPCSL